MQANSQVAMCEPTKVLERVHATHTHHLLSPQEAILIPPLLSNLLHGFSSGAYTYTGHFSSGTL